MDSFLITPEDEKTCTSLLRERLREFEIEREREGESEFMQQHHMETEYLVPKMKAK